MKYNLDIKKIILLLVGVVLIQSCKRSIDTPVEDAIAPATANIVQLTDAQFKNAEIQVSNPEKMMIGKVIHLNGKIEVMPENMITVSSPMAVFDRQIKWMPGMTVSKGQSLVRLQEKEYIQLQQDYLSAKTSLKFAKQDYERQSELSKSQAASDKILQQAEELLVNQGLVFGDHGVPPLRVGLQQLAEQLPLLAAALHVGFSHALDFERAPHQAIQRDEGLRLEEVALAFFWREGIHQLLGQRAGIALPVHFGAPGFHGQIQQGHFVLGIMVDKGQIESARIAATRADRHVHRAAQHTILHPRINTRIQDLLDVGLELSATHGTGNTRNSSWHL